jgi:acyl-coenzyme A synthetase/AMP-(fatty) acid ligase
LPSDRLIVNTGLHYVGALDVYFPPSRGCTAYLLSDHEAMFADRIVDVMESERTTIWKSSATALRLLTENGHLEGRQLAALRRIDFVGEPLSMDVLRRAMSALPHTAFLHRFGATEAYRIAQYPVPRPLPPDMAELPLGRPGARYRLSLRGDDDRDVAPGERGEICVIGSTVTLGYWKDPALTAAKRLDGRPDSFRTGDLGRLDKDGLLRWIGRLDQVVKIRGHRVDLGEIEAVLRAHAGVRECAAFAVAGGDGQLEIRVAILPTDGDDLDADLRILCIKRLPAHARPASFLALPSFPFLPSGKIDRQALLVRIEGN